MNTAGELHKLEELLDSVVLIKEKFDKEKLKI